MEANRKVEARGQRSEARGQKPDAATDGRVLVTRRGLAVALGVSLRTVERMLHDQEIEPVRLRGLVRFHVPDVIECLRDGERKWGRKADGEKLKAETLKAEIQKRRGGIA